LSGLATDAKRARAGFELLGFRYNQSSVLPCAHFEIAIFKLGADFLAPKSYKRAYICAAALLIGGSISKWTY